MEPSFRALRSFVYEIERLWEKRVRLPDPPLPNDSHPWRHWQNLLFWPLATERTAELWRRGMRDESALCERITDEALKTLENFSESGLSAEMCQGLLRSSDDVYREKEWRDIIAAGVKEKRDQLLKEEALGARKTSRRKRVRTEQEMAEGQAFFTAIKRYQKKQGVPSLESIAHLLGYKSDTSLYDIRDGGRISRRVRARAKELDIRWSSGKRKQSRR